MNWNCCPECARAGNGCIQFRMKLPRSNSGPALPSSSAAGTWEWLRPSAPNSSTPVAAQADTAPRQMNRRRSSRPAWAAAMCRRPRIRRRTGRYRWAWFRFSGARNAGRSACSGVSAQSCFALLVLTILDGSPLLGNFTFSVEAPIHFRGLAARRQAEASAGTRGATSRSSRALFRYRDAAGPPRDKEQIATATAPARA